MPSTHITRLKDYFDRVDRHRNRSNMLTLGDSWFQYPLRSYPDLQTRLSGNSYFGTRANILDDSTPGRDAREVKRRIKQWRRIAGELAHRGRPFSAILLSLGGNDVIGLDFRDHITDGTTPSTAAWPWHPNVPPLIRRWLDLAALKSTFDVIADNYGLIIAMRDELAPAATIVCHTYADVTPMKKGYTFDLFGIRSGPWIWKYLAPLGLTDAEQKQIVRWLLESFHALLLQLKAASVDPARFIVLDTRLELPDPAQWDNEIHPLGPGFTHLADTFWKPVLEPLV